jgi:bisphosphoglycerate-independent phosphoglycerate mutase (AlkP superfamily)
VVIFFNYRNDRAKELTAVSVALEAQPPSTGVSAAMPRKAAKVRRERGAMVSSFLFVDEIS